VRLSLSRNQVHSARLPLCSSLRRLATALAASLPSKTRPSDYADASTRRPLTILVTVPTSSYFWAK
jgi:hypothetical protein